MRIKLIKKTNEAATKSYAFTWWDNEPTSDRRPTTKADLKNCLHKEIFLAVDDAEALKLAVEYLCDYTGKDPEDVGDTPEEVWDYFNEDWGYGDPIPMVLRQGRRIVKDSGFYPDDEGDDDEGDDNDSGLESKSIKNENILSGLLAKNPVWNEICDGDTAELADNIEKGEWIGLMAGAEDDTDAGWDKYIADTFGPFVDFVEARYIKPDENEPDFRVTQIKFKPLFNRLSTNAKTGLLTDLGDKIADGYFA